MLYTDDCPEMTNEKIVNTALEKAKKIVERWYGDKPGAREWLVASPPDSYSDPQYRVTTLVLRGSPPKGYILVDYHYGIIKLFGTYFWKTRTIRALDDFIKENGRS